MQGPAWQFDTNVFWGMSLMSDDHWLMRDCTAPPPKPESSQLNSSPPSQV